MNTDDDFLRNQVIKNAVPLRGLWSDRNCSFGLGAFRSRNSSGLELGKVRVRI
jgi:hypothetical protein